MNRLKDLKKEELEAIFESIPTAVYVSDLENYSLLYINDLAREVMPNKNLKIGDKCYTGLNCDKACSFCKISKMNYDSLHVREYFNVANNKYYLMKGKLINWGGRPAHIEYIVDISMQKSAEVAQVENLKDIYDFADNVPCGLCIYKVEGNNVTPVIHNKVFYSLIGFSKEHLDKINEKSSFLSVHPDDSEMIKSSIQKALIDGKPFRIIFRLFNNEHNEYRWIRADGALKISKDHTLAYVVYTDANKLRVLQSELSNAQQKMQDIVDSISGGVASFKVTRDGNFVSTFFTEGLPEIVGLSYEEYGELTRDNAIKTIYEKDQDRVRNATIKALYDGGSLDISFRMIHKDGHLVWVHVNGKRIGPIAEEMHFNAVFTGMSEETKLFRSLADETADGIYVIDSENFGLLYANESKRTYRFYRDYEGKKCYNVIYGLDKPCSFCGVRKFKPDGLEHMIENNDRTMSLRFTETNWNGIDAFVVYLKDITEEIEIRREKERMELYFQTLIKNIPGGVAVITVEPDGRMIPEYVSEGFARLIGKPLDSIKGIYSENFFAGIHPDDASKNQRKLNSVIKEGRGSCELVARYIIGENKYKWIKTNLTLMSSHDGRHRMYSVYTDITDAMEESIKVKAQFEDILIQHYQDKGPNIIRLGHDNVTKNIVLNRRDFASFIIEKSFTFNREEYVEYRANEIQDLEERQIFKATFSTTNLKAAFARGEREQSAVCFITFPNEEKGRYVRYKTVLVESPDTKDLIAVLSVEDVTETIIRERIKQQLYITNCDYVCDLNLFDGTYKLLACGKDVSFPPHPSGKIQERVQYMLENSVVPRCHEIYAKALDPEMIINRLKDEDNYSITYSLVDEHSEVRTKKLTISNVDLRLGRVSFINSDMTDSVREQQSLLNVIAYTFDLTSTIDIEKDTIIMHTRESIINKLPAKYITNYSKAINANIDESIYDEPSKNMARLELSVPRMLERLKESPEGYDFILPYTNKKGEIRYKQAVVIWGDVNHKTICLIRADVTDVLNNEKKTSEKLEAALAIAEEASRAKSDFLSTMSHDIRTPMNAIIGLTTLAQARIDDKEIVEGYLEKISIASKHLLSLINDVLDMSKIERSKLNLNYMRINMNELIDQLVDIMEPQAKAHQLIFDVEKIGLNDVTCLGDSLRINQVLINIIGNAIKYTPEGGKINFKVEQIKPSVDSKFRFRYTVSDTGIGIPDEFLESVFVPFSRSFAVARVEGAGLGLSIVKGLVDLMGGKISATSKLNEGSVFQVELEFDIAPEIVTDDNGIVNINDDIISGHSFLIVEDNDINAEIICELLALNGGTVKVAKDGSKAISIFNASPEGTYDVIFMDIQMPVLDGLEASRRIRKLDRKDAKKIPIIAMTANAFVEDVQMSLEAGMTAHIAKPIDMAVVKAVLNKVFNQ